MNRSHLILGACVALTVPAFAEAQSSGAPSRTDVSGPFNAGRQRVGGMPAQFGWQWSGQPDGSVEIFLQPVKAGTDGGRPTRLLYVARQVVGERGQEVVSWTDSDHCPGLSSVAERFEGLRAPPTVIPARNWPPLFPMIVLDGTGWTLWSDSAQQEGRYPGRVIMSAASGPIAEFGMAAITLLSSCWSSAKPTDAS